MTDDLREFLQKLNSLLVELREEVKAKPYLLPTAIIDAIADLIQEEVLK